MGKSRPGGTMLSTPHPWENHYKIIPSVSWWPPLVPTLSVLLPPETLFLCLNICLSWKACWSHTSHLRGSESALSALRPPSTFSPWPQACTLAGWPLPLCSRALPSGTPVGGCLEKPGTKQQPDPVPWQGVKEPACSSCGILAQRVVEGIW